MLKSKKAKDAAKRVAALTLAFLMVFQYTASAMSVYAWAEDGSDKELNAVEEQVETKSEEKEEAPAEKAESEKTEQKTEPPAEEKKEEQAPQEEQKPAEEVTQPEQTAEEPEKQEEPQTQEEEKKDEEEKDDEVKYPAQSFVKTVSGVTVRIQAPEDALPEGSDVVITPVKAATAQKKIENSTGDEVKVVKAMDITFKDKDGNETEPRKKVAVNFEYEKFGNIESPKVYHIDDNGQAEKLSDKNVGVYNDQVSFNVQNFSTYAIAEDLAPKANANEVTAADPEETWTVSFYDRDADPHATVKVAKGQAIGAQLPAVIEREDYTAYWAIGEIVSGQQGTEIKVTEPVTKVTADTIVTSDMTVVPYYEQISYTVTFYKEDKTTVVATKTVNSDTSYSLNDIPSVPSKSGYVGKWVYEGGDFNNQVRLTGDTDVWAEYEKNVFTVTYKVNDDATYKTETYYTWDNLVLPAAPVVEGKEFDGWFVGEKEYKGGEEVTSDLTLTAKFKDEYKVSFVIEDGDEQTEHVSQYIRVAGETIGTMPQDPFVNGKVFEKWVIKGTETEVTADTVVNENITAVAVFREVAVYDITAEYYYLNDRGEEVVFNTDLLQVETHELPYTITAPSTTQTSSDEVAGGPIYYPETPTVEVKKTDFNSDKKYTVRFQYVPFTAEYDFVYMLKDLDGEGYTEIERTHEYGVLNSNVTPTVKTYDYAVLERADGAIIERAEGQELKVYYTRKNYQLSYNTNGGSYVAGNTVPYGTTVNLPSTNPTREGYSFDGWYSDDRLTDKVTGSITVNDNTTLYAKWTGDDVEYTVIYMKEQYNDEGTETSYVYEDSRTVTGEVGTEVTASNPPDTTFNARTKIPYHELDDTKNASGTDSTKVTIRPDGSTVLMVYYRLKEYTFTFNAGTVSTGWYSTANVSATLPGKNVTNQTGDLTYSFRAKLGQNISTLWPSSGTGTYRTGWNQQTHNVTLFGWRKPGDSTMSQDLKQYRVTSALLPSSGNSIQYTAVWTDGDTTYSVNIYLQNADDDDYTKSDIYSQTFVGDGWQQGGWGQQSGFAITYSHDPINGYIYNESKSTPDSTWEYTGNHKNPYMNIYYDLEKYQIEYRYKGDTYDHTLTQISYGKNINTETYNWTPVAKAGEEDYTFDGWYADADLTTKYSFNTMPASNLVLYAKWIAPTYTVDFDLDGGTPSIEDQTVEKYKKATAPETTPTKTGYTFDGWYTSADGNTLFDWNTQITADTTIYAHWTKNTLSYTVHYIDEAGTTLAPDKVVTNPNLEVGQNVTEQAIAVAGYRPNESSKTIPLEDSNNVITFKYSKKADKTSYTVKYIIDPDEYPGNIPIAAEKTVEDVPGVRLQLSN